MLEEHWSECRPDPYRTHRQVPAGILCGWRIRCQCRWTWWSSGVEQVQYGMGSWCSARPLVPVSDLSTSLFDLMTNHINRPLKILYFSKRKLVLTIQLQDFCNVCQSSEICSVDVEFHVVCDEQSKCKSEQLQLDGVLCQLLFCHKQSDSLCLFGAFAHMRPFGGVKETITVNLSLIQFRIFYIINCAMINKAFHKVLLFLHTHSHHLQVVEGLSNSYPLHLDHHNTQCLV